MSSPGIVTVIIGFCVAIGVAVGLLDRAKKSAETPPNVIANFPSLADPSNGRTKSSQLADPKSQLSSTSTWVGDRKPVRLTSPESVLEKWEKEGRLDAFILKQNEQWIYLRNEYGDFIIREDGSRCLSPAGKKYLSLTQQAATNVAFTSLDRHDYAMERLEKELRTLASSTPDWPPFVTNRRDNRFYPHLGGQRVSVITTGGYCLQLAQTVLQVNKLREQRFNDANLALVVVRSNGSSDMRYSYPSADRLFLDAKHHLNDSGSIGHIHVYFLSRKQVGRRVEVSATQLFHERLNWLDFELGQ